MEFIKSLAIMILAGIVTWFVTAFFAVFTSKIERDENNSFTDTTMLRIVMKMTMVEALVAAVAITLLII